jgi:hypothetical protein
MKYVIKSVLAFIGYPTPHIQNPLALPGSLNPSAISLTSFLPILPIPIRQTLRKNEVGCFTAFFGKTRLSAGFAFCKIAIMAFNNNRQLLRILFRSRRGCRIGIYRCDALGLRGRGIIFPLAFVRCPCRLGALALNHRVGYRLLCGNMFFTLAASQRRQ